MDIQKIETITVSLETKPGELRRVTSAFREAGVNLKWVWAHEMGPNEAQGIFWAENTDKAFEVLKTMGKKPKKGGACVAWGTDQLGCMDDMLKKIESSNVNLHATDAFGIEGKFGTVFFADSSKLPDLCKALEN